MAYGHSIIGLQSSEWKPLNKVFEKRINESMKQNRLDNPLTEKDQFIEQLNFLKNQMKDIIDELRYDVRQISGLSDLVYRCEQLETTFMTLENQFNKTFNVEIIVDKSATNTEKK